MTDLIRIIIIMSLSGSALALLLFVLKPIVRNYLPKSAQYYLWLIVIIALLVPISQIVVLPDNQTTPLPVAPVVSENVSRFVITQGEQQARLQDISHLANTNNTAYLQERQMIESPIVNLTTLFMIIYPFGVLIFGLYYLVNYMKFARLYRRRNRSASDEALALLGQMCSESVQARSTCTPIRSGKTPKLYRNPLATSPMLLGIFRPAIILPEVDYSEEQLHAIFAHELIHLRRKDSIVKWLTLIATCLHWFNPIVWFVRREIVKSCELACDEAVIQSLDTSNKQNYGNVLLDVSANFTTPKAIAATMMCEEKKNLKERLDFIIKSKKHTRIAIALSLVLIVSAVCLVLVLGSGSDNANNNLDSGTGVSTSSTDNFYVFEDLSFGIRLVLPAEFEGNYRLSHRAVTFWRDYPPNNTIEPVTLTLIYSKAEPHIHHGRELFSIHRFDRENSINIEDWGVLLLETDTHYFVFSELQSHHIEELDTLDLSIPETIEYLQLVIRSHEVHERLRAYPLPLPTFERVVWTYPDGSTNQLFVAPTIFPHLDSEFGILLALPREFMGNYSVTHWPITFTLNDNTSYNFVGPVTRTFLFSRAEPHIHQGRELFSIHRFDREASFNIEDWGVLILKTGEHYFVFSEPRNIEMVYNLDLSIPDTVEYLQLVIRNHEVHDRLRASPCPFSDTIYLPFNQQGTYQLILPLPEGADQHGIDRLVHPLPADSFTLSATFGMQHGRMHNGVDWHAPRGTPVSASDGGIVTYSGYLGAFGELIIIYHGNGIETHYAHLNERHVSEGDQVFQGQHIGDVGSTGRSTGPHLHFELHIDGVPRNPLPFL